jgi:two-component system, NtrC family, response regulator HydG
LKILIIDDAIPILDALRNALKPSGHDCTTCHTSRSGLEAFRNGNFDLVITDLVMPDMDGIEVIRAIRNIRRNVDIVLITGYPPHMNSTKEIIELGVETFLRKPLNFKELMEVIQRVETKAQSYTDQDQQLKQ